MLWLGSRAMSEAILSWNVVCSYANCMLDLQNTMLRRHLTKLRATVLVVCSFAEVFGGIIVVTGFPELAGVNSV